MKLESKHIAPYLPYGLKIRSFRYNNDLFIEDILITGEFLDYLFENSHSRINSPNYYKPILRPLSDLVKEIKVNGEKFVPIDVLFIGLTPKEKRLNYFEIEQQSKIGFSYVSFWIVQKLFEWHFDVFNLIEQGLAVNLNNFEKVECGGKNI